MLQVIEPYTEICSEHLFFSYAFIEVTKIFEQLSVCFHSENWLQNALDNEYDLEEMSTFSARHYKFACSDTKDPTISVEFGTVEKNRKGKTLYYYDCEDYCKRLLGNTYSIPVVEHLLRPLKLLFLEREYNGAMYKFVWETNSDS